MILVVITLSEVVRVSVLRRRVNRVATISVHTSPLDQPGTGDAGGMNVYILEVAKRLAALGIEVEIFTRRTARDLPPVAELSPGVLVRHVTAGPYEELDRADLPGQLCGFLSGVLRTEAMYDPGRYDVIHSHYWLSGQVGWLAKERWGVPLVHTMHTMAKVKNALLAEGDKPEPAMRVLGEEQVVEVADRLVANTAAEAEELISLYGAPRERVAVVNPGVNLAVFQPESKSAARRRLGLPQDAHVLLFVGRIQPLKAPDVLLRAAARMLVEDPSLRSRLVVACVGGPSGNGLAHPSLLSDLAAELGIADVVRLAPPAPQPELADWYRAADVTVVPSYNESFGLVALESQACGTPVVAAAVGGLRTAVKDGVSGVLVAGHDPHDWARELAVLARRPDRLAELAASAVQHATGFGWSATAARLADVYAGAMAQLHRTPIAVNS
ncbi:D-inositol-3-phosphate glycosyltransferase [Microbispora catharanthi]|uniref:D-inositol-3-phosphate glycosyltransferase n=1 Tax=Microbispora catharanthi TaxID=1712871 RepID=A0A5N6B3Q5_9ACTN|nr:D-inositol-3-phosphate glycosyltransferase [Microbispora catharanthi]